LCGSLPEWPGGQFRSAKIVTVNAHVKNLEALARLHLRPVFVGIERDLIRAAINDDPQAVRSRIADTVSPDEFARPDRAGGWIIPLGEERRIIGSA
jgi:hypothetical protein